MLPRNVYGGDNEENQCFNDDRIQAEDGLQNISPCQYGKDNYLSNIIYAIDCQAAHDVAYIAVDQYCPIHFLILSITFLLSTICAGAPVYISNPHFYESNPKFLNEVEGLTPSKEAHETFLKIQPVRKIG